MKKKSSKKGEVSDDSQQQNDNKSDKSDNSNEQVNTDNSPKYIPVAKLPQKLKTKKIVINISDTQYPIIQEIAEELGWVIEKEVGQGNWDLWWTDREITPDTLFKMNLHQKINHFPGIYVLARKNMLGLNLMAMRDRFREQYDFFPETWVIPLQFSKFRAFYQTEKMNNFTYIVKPEALSQGRGIFLTRNIGWIMTGRKYVVQRYLTNPLLIDDLKFDLRIYVLMAGTDPLRLYLYQQGLTRFATKKYQQPTQQNLNMPFIHLTNYSLNKQNPQYIYNTSQDSNTGHKRSLSSTYQYLSKKGYNVTRLKQQIEDLIVKTVIAGLPAISHQYQYCQPDQFQNNMCFHILGVDVMIDRDLKPYLIQINHTPSFETGTPLDYKVKKNLIIDTIKIMRITSKKKRNLFEKAKQLVKHRVQNGKREIFKGQRRQQLLLQAQQKRDQQQQGLLGNFKKIYPLKQNPQKMQEYQKMIEHASEVHKETEETRRKFIRDEQEKEKIKAKNRSSSQADNNREHKDRDREKDKDKDKHENRDREHREQKGFKNKTYNPHLKRESHEHHEQHEHPHPHPDSQHSVPQLPKQPQTDQTSSIDISQSTHPTHPNHHPNHHPHHNSNQHPNSLPHSYPQIPDRSTTNIIPLIPGTGSKNCNFRTKTKRNIYNNPKQQFIKFSQFMLNYITHQNGRKDKDKDKDKDRDRDREKDNVGMPVPVSSPVNPVELDQDTFYKIKRAADKRKRELCSNQRQKQKQKQKQRQKNKQGTYIIPKMYQIIDSKAAIRIEAQLVKKINREREAPSPQISESQKLVKSLNSYKGMYKKKRPSIY